MFLSRLPWTFLVFTIRVRTFMLMMYRTALIFTWRMYQSGWTIKQKALLLALVLLFRAMRMKLPDSYRNWEQNCVAKQATLRTPQLFGSKGNCVDLNLALLRQGMDLSFSWYVSGNGSALYLGCSLAMWGAWILEVWSCLLPRNKTWGHFSIWCS